MSAATPKSVAYGERECVRPALPKAEAILAALMRAPAGMAVPDRVGIYTGHPVRWREKGRGWEGCDCWGLCCLIYRLELGRELPDHRDAYEAAQLGKDATRGDLAALAGAIAGRSEDGFRQIAFDQARLFDLLLLPIAGEPCHITMYVGDLRILHIEEGCDAVCEDLREGRWHGRLRHARVYRFVGGAQ